MTIPSWSISYYFPGPDKRHNGTHFSISGKNIHDYIEALIENWKELQALKITIPQDGTFRKEGRLKMWISVGRYSSGVNLKDFHMNVYSEERLNEVVASFRYAAKRGPQMQKLLASITLADEPGE